jgi:hypothetical protein
LIISGVLLKSKRSDTKAGKTLSSADFQAPLPTIRNSQIVNSSSAVIPASEARQESFQKLGKIPVKPE